MAWPAPETVVTRIAAQHVVSGPARKAIVAAATDDHVGTPATRELVVPGAAPENVALALAAVDHVATGTSQDAVVAAFGADHVVAAAAAYQVVTRTCPDDIPPPGTDEPIRTRCADDRRALVTARGSRAARGRTLAEFSCERDRRSRHDRSSEREKTATA